MADEIPDELLKAMAQDALLGLGVLELSDRDAACGILPNVDYWMQLIVIKSLIQRNAKEKKNTNAQIAEAKELAQKSSGVANERAIDEYGRRSFFHLPRRDA